MHGWHKVIIAPIFLSRGTLSYSVSLCQFTSPLSAFSFCSNQCLSLPTLHALALGTSVPGMRAHSLQMRAQWVLEILTISIAPPHWPWVPMQNILLSTPKSNGLFSDRLVSIVSLNSFRKMGSIDTTKLLYKSVLEKDNSFFILLKIHKISSFFTFYDIVDECKK